MTLLQFLQFINLLRVLYPLDHSVRNTAVDLSIFEAITLFGCLYI